MPEIVIADTSFLIAIEKMQLFNEIHRLYDQIFITKEIAEEFHLDMPEWIHKKAKKVCLRPIP